ncbi:helix-turn-helix domain-containing protein [Streptomyces sp. NPDC053493]|uniref:helix-turn-helix domain-containing protein n=1 Tax=Streptomyces sp. NPDC053493 TaxID=3365705 RepID=UPI0037CEDD09
MHDNLTVKAGRPASVSPLRPKDVASALGVNVQTVYVLVRQGDLPAYRVGTGRGTIRISRAAFDQYLADRGIPASELAVAS